MLQSTGLQRVGQDLATEQQQKIVLDFQQKASKPPRPSHFDDANSDRQTNG